MTKEELRQEAIRYLENFKDCANCKNRWGDCADQLYEYCLINGCCFATPKEQDIYLAGAEFGYNKAKIEVEESYRESICNSELNLANVTEQLEELEKANEWHYVKDELPELYKDVLVVFPRGDCDVKRLTNHNEWVGRGSWCSLTDVIAWKEIVLPKESE